MTGIKDSASWFLNGETEHPGTCPYRFPWRPEGDPGQLLVAWLTGHPSGDQGIASEP